jgi:transcriptional regulator with XRE-family HTH domain
MKVMHENSDYNDYFNEIQGFYANQEKTEKMEPIGVRLKKIREMQNFYLEQFAKITKIDKDKIAKIENQEILPDLGTTVKLSRALNIGTGFLLGEESGYSYSVVRMEDRKNIARHLTGKSDRPNYVYQSLASGIKNKHMESFIVTLTTDANAGDLSSHDGEEFIVVLDGSIKVVLGNKEEVLKEGDSIYYLATIPHNVMNISRTDNAVLLAVIYTGG